VHPDADDGRTGAATATILDASFVSALGNVLTDEEVAAFETRMITFAVVLLSDHPGLG